VAVDLRLLLGDQREDAIGGVATAGGTTPAGGDQRTDLER
jgi:hypothetical protein